MPRKPKEVKVESSIFRVMVEQVPYKMIHVDFSIKEESLEYAHNLTSENAAWYGIYEVSQYSAGLIPVEHRRLRPHPDSIPRTVNTSDDSASIKQRRKTRQKKK